MYKNKALIIAVSVGLIAGFWLFGGRPALASFPADTGGGGSFVTNSAPTPGSLKYDPSTTAPGTNPINGNNTPYFDVGNDPQYNYPSRIKVYVKAGQTLQLTVNNAGAGCQPPKYNGAPPAGGAAGGPDYGEYAPTTIGPTTDFEIDGASGRISSVKTALGTQCNDIVFSPPTITNANSWRIKDAAGRWITVGGYNRFVLLWARASGSIVGENSFRITTASDSRVGFSSDIVGTGFGFRDKSVAHWHHWTAQIVFGLPADCNTASQTSSQPIYYGNIDYGLYDDGQVTFELQSKGFSGGWQIEKAAWKPPDVKNGTRAFNYTYNTQKIYRLILHYVGTEDTINIGLGGVLSQIAVYDPSPTDCSTGGPNVSCKASANPTGVLPGGASTVTIQGIGNVKWVADGGNGYYIKRINTTDNEANYSQTQGSNPYTNVVHPAPASGTGPVTYTYSVYDSSGKTVPGATCTATVNVANFVAECARTVINEPAGSYYIEWHSSSGPVGAYYPIANSTSVDTFNTYTFLWPHLNYTAYLYKGTYPTGSLVTRAALNSGTPCLQFTGCTANYSPNPAEIGAKVTFSFSVEYTNSTGHNIPFGSFSSDARKYDTVASSTGGVSIDPPLTVQRLMRLGPTQSFSYTGHIDYSGTYNLAMVPDNDRGNNLLPSACPGGASAVATPVALPYFQAWNGDVSSGGGFASPNGSPFINIPYNCGGKADPPYVTSGTNNGYSYAFSGNKYSGSIIGFGEQANNRGSRVDFGAVAMGQIPGTTTGPIGFFSGDSSRPVFANTSNVYGAAGMGGYLGGYAPNLCVKDYYSDSQQNAKPTSDLATDISNCSANSCQFKSDTSMTICPSASGQISVPQGTQLSLYVNGDVTINCNLVYQKSFDPTKQGNIPYLAIIAKGDISVGPGVTELDGLYVAQPTGTGANPGTDDGIFYTCDPSQNCNSQLVVNGAVIAQQVQLLRNHGTLLGSCPTGSGVSGCPAEIFNFVPSMVIGEPAFPSQFGETQGVFSLAPTF